MRLRTILLLLCMLATLSVSAGGYSYYAALKTNALKEIEMRSASHTQDIARLSTLMLTDRLTAVKALSGVPELRQALQDPDENTATVANSILDHFKESLGADVCYLLNREGTTILSSNRNEPDSFIGKNYSFRPYFKRAIHGFPYAYMALGVTSKKRGIYFSHPVQTSGSEAPAGVVVMKTSVEKLEKSILTHHYHQNGMITLITGPYSVVFISDHDRFLYQLLWKIPDRERSEISASRQFGAGPWEWTGFVRVGINSAIDQSGNKYFVNSAEIESMPGWNIVHLMNINAISTQLATPFINAIGVVVLLLALVAGGSTFILYRMGKSSIDKRIQSEKALRGSEAQKQAILDGISFNLAFVDQDLRILWANKAAAESVNEKPENMLGQRCHELWADPNATCVGCPTVIAFQTKKAEHGIMVTPDGRTWDERGEPVFDPDGNLIGVVEIARDITEEKRKEIALQESEARYRRLTENAQDVIWRTDAEGTILFVNAAVEKVLGYAPENVVGLTMEDYMVQPSIERVIAEAEKALSEQPPRDHFRLNVDYVAQDGGVVPCEIVVVILLDEARQVVGYEGISRDITDKIRIEKELRQAHKMEAVGTLAGGIAHEFNNILGIVLGNAELAFSDTPEWNPTRDFLKEIRIASLRGKDVVKQLLSFSRKHDPKKRPLKLSSVIEESMGLLRASISSNIAIELHVAEDCRTIMGNQTQIHQVMINLCTNAVHAMEKDGGKLSISAENVVLEKQEVLVDQILEAGEYVRLSFCDSGHGIPADTLERIFDPFYTTKEVGHGSGMGLSVVLGIMKGHDGGIRIWSKPGEGARVDCFFPALDAMPYEEPEAGQALPGGKEAILVVDDEEPLVMINKQRLERLGYRAQTCTDPLEALEIFKSDPEKFDLVITDMSMPRMTGDQLVRELLVIRPNVKTIICTGYSYRIDDAKAGEIGASAFLMKPVELEQLAGVTRDVLDR